MSLECQYNELRARGESWDMCAVHACVDVKRFVYHQSCQRLDWN